ncbi:MAG: hypothetical protein QOF53_864 [Nocardioidaceae bacterium]|jgi:hypothetical protein|nr:hypothetical protein [Nocardioidaceae bacterium]
MDLLPLDEVQRRLRADVTRIETFRMGPEVDVRQAR